MKIRWPHYLMIAPVQSMLVVIILAPTAYVGWLSFNQSTFGLDTSFVGWQNYAFIVTDPQFWRAFLNTFIVVNAVVYGELALGLAIAVLFASGVPFRRVLISIVLAPYAISPVLGVLMWKYMLEPDVGVLNYALTWLGLRQLEWTINPTHGLVVIILLSIWMHTPFTFVITYSAILAIPTVMFEAARVDGANSLQIFRRITVPVIMPSIFIALMFRYVVAFRIFSEVWILTKGGPVWKTETLAIYLYRYGFRYHEFGVASATGWAMLLATLLIAAYYFRLMYKRMFVYED